MGSHPFPFRTRKLSPPAPMVLGRRLPGRVGRRRISQTERGPSGPRSSFSYLFIGPIRSAPWPPLPLDVPPADPGVRALGLHHHAPRAAVVLRPEHVAVDDRIDVLTTLPGRLGAPPAPVGRGPLGPRPGVARRARERRARRGVARKDRRSPATPRGVVWPDVAPVASRRAVRGRRPPGARSWRRRVRSCRRC